VRDRQRFASNRTVLTHLTRPHLAPLAPLCDPTLKPSG
jgi:hypothetical protein